MPSSQYRLTEHDFAAFHRYLLERHRTLVLRNAFLGGLGPGVVFYSTQGETHDKRAALIAGAALTPLCALSSTSITGHKPVTAPSN